MRTVIIGDVHGCDKALCALLEKTKALEADRLILLGDLFDRGPESWEVFRTVRALAARLGDRFTLLKGNHEDYLLAPKLSLFQRMIWDRVGRGTTDKSFKAHGEKMEDTAAWLRENCKLFYRDEEIQCVHAGLLMDPIEVNDTDTLLHDHDIVLRNVYKGRLTIVGHIALKEPTYFAGDGETKETLPCGEWHVLPETGIICIDTGCGKGGALTGMIVQDGRYRMENVNE